MFSRWLMKRLKFWSERWLRNVDWKFLKFWVYGLKLRVCVRAVFAVLRWMSYWIKMPFVAKPINRSLFIFVRFLIVLRSTSRSKKTNKLIISPKFTPNDEIGVSGEIHHFSTLPLGHCFGCVTGLPWKTYRLKKKKMFS